MSRLFGAVTKFISVGKQTLTASGAQAVQFPQITASQQFTYSCWVFRTGSAANLSIVNMVDNINHAYTLRYNSTNNRYEGVIFSSSITNGDGTVPFQLPLNTWQHVAMTYNANTDGLAHIYVNGIEIGYFTQPANLNFINLTAGLSINTLRIGTTTAANTFFIGNIAEFSLFARALNQSEVLQIAQSTTGLNTGMTFVRDGSLVAYLHISGQDSPEKDSSGNGNIGTLSSSVATYASDSPGYSFTAGQPGTLPSPGPVNVTDNGVVVLNPA